MVLEVHKLRVGVGKKAHIEPGFHGSLGAEHWSGKARMNKKNSVN
jgi:hypothetical protein